MKYLITVLFSLILISSGQVNSQSNFSWQENKLILENGVIERTIVLDKENQTIETKSIFHRDNEINFVSSNLNLSVKDKQLLLEIDNLQDRALATLKHMNVELQKLALQKDIQSKVRSDLDQQQRIGIHWKKYHPAQEK